MLHTQALYIYTHCAPNRWAHTLTPRLRVTECKRKSRTSPEGRGGGLYRGEARDATGGMQEASEQACKPGQPERTGSGTDLEYPRERAGGSGAPPPPPPPCVTFRLVAVSLRGPGQSPPPTPPSPPPPLDMMYAYVMYRKRSHNLCRIRISGPQRPLAIEPRL